MQEGPTFSCPACGNRYPWLQHLAGRKGKCKCGAIMSIPARAPGAVMRRTQSASSVSRPLVAAGAPRPHPRPMPVPFDRDHDDAHDSRNGSAVGASPGASSFGASAPEVAANEVEQTDAASTAGGDATVTEKTWLQKLNWISAAKWFAVALFLFGWMASELNKPTNPATPGPKVGFRALIVYVNMLVGLRAGGVLLALAMFAALGTGIWVLIKKPKEAATA